VKCKENAPPLQEKKIKKKDRRQRAQKFKYAGGLSDIKGLLSPKIWGPALVSFEPPQLHTQSPMFFYVFF
jgi:hypothetical protein